MFGFITHAIAGLTLLACGCPVLALCMVAGGSVYLIGSGDDE